MYKLNKGSLKCFQCSRSLVFPCVCRENTEGETHPLSAGPQRGIAPVCAENPDSPGFCVSSYFHNDNAPFMDLHVYKRNWFIRILHYEPCLLAGVLGPPALSACSVRNENETPCGAGAAPHPLGTETKGGSARRRRIQASPRGEAVPGANAVRNSTGGLRSQNCHFKARGRNPTCQSLRALRQGPEAPVAHVFSRGLLAESISQPRLNLF